MHMVTHEDESPGETGCVGVLAYLMASTEPELWEPLADDGAERGRRAALVDITGELLAELAVEQLLDGPDDDLWDDGDDLPDELPVWGWSA